VDAEKEECADWIQAVPDSPISLKVKEAEALLS
jgi:hypothetical protein